MCTGSTHAQFRISRSESSSLPSNIYADLTFVAVLNLGANFRKHRDDWGLRFNVICDRDTLCSLARQMIDAIEVLTPWDDYTLSFRLNDMRHW